MLVYQRVVIQILSTSLMLPPRKGSADRAFGAVLNHLAVGLPGLQSLARPRGLTKERRGVAASLVIWAQFNAILSWNDLEWIQYYPV